MIFHGSIYDLYSRDKTLKLYYTLIRIQRLLFIGDLR
jgi:hypothetical protein